MTTVVAIVEETKVDTLTKRLIANGWGDNYALIDRGTTSDERIYAAPMPFAADSGPLAAGVVLEPGAATNVAAVNEGVLHTNVKEELDEFDLSIEEKEFYARLISDGGTFIAVEVDEAGAERVQDYFAEVDAQQMETTD